MFCSEKVEEQDDPLMAVRGKEDGFESGEASFGDDNVLPGAQVRVSNLVNAAADSLDYLVRHRWRVVIEANDSPDAPSRGDGEPVILNGVEADE